MRRTSRTARHTPRARIRRDPRDGRRHGRRPALAQSSPTPSPSEASPGPAEETFGDQVVLLGTGHRPARTVGGRGDRLLGPGRGGGDRPWRRRRRRRADLRIGTGERQRGRAGRVGPPAGTAQVSGDVLAHDRVIVAQGASRAGADDRGCLVQPEPSLARRGAVRVVDRRGRVDAVARPAARAPGSPRVGTEAEAGRARRGPPPGGARAGVGRPVLAVLAVASVLGIPLGIGLVLSFLLLRCSAWW